ncbi:hypothetical protein PCASD_13317 [Puccinia coronata f. sp. avenae]|uniref:DDE Tnp4 domain-containing protein n=1 Tax=Puccinia coronata f. sp. avenae TaxID=200324 RepID=A0A2N5U8W2_9BASI|nr:hypothetical protein PCASD_13317 [Puccinia coronata f. sp. avenae]
MVANLVCLDFSLKKLDRSFSAKRPICSSGGTGVDVPILEKKYFLADAGYALQKGLLTPFQATRYHLKEQAAAGLRPATQKELYNLRHSSLRNVVERLFGCLKAKFKILTTPYEHSIERQVQLVYALATLWNFLRNHQQLDDNQILMDDEAFKNRSDEETNPTPHLRLAVEDAAMGS